MPADVSVAGDPGDVTDDCVDGVLADRVPVGAVSADGVCLDGDVLPWRDEAVAEADDEAGAGGGVDFGEEDGGVGLDEGAVGLGDGEGVLAEGDVDFEEGESDLGDGDVDFEDGEGVLADGDVGLDEDVGAEDVGFEADEGLDVRDAEAVDEFGVADLEGPVGAGVGGQGPAVAPGVRDAPGTAVHDSGRFHGSGSFGGLPFPSRRPEASPRWRSTHSSWCGS
ncbi:hypothetical protein [Streptomyces naphthomycinicus]|uniref:hypothetical protein n=1 Tax=Streptomyces naphthomycinicus TaxID=2872625 RepID=UPI001CED2CC1